MKTILLIADYAACYRGNFIPSIEAIDYTLSASIDNMDEPTRMVYLFPDVAKEQPWMLSFQNEHTTYFIPRSFFAKRFTFHDLSTLYHILRKERVSLIHTHFIFYNYALCLAHHIFARRIPIIGQFHNQFRIPATRSAFLKRFVVEHTYAQILGVSSSVADGVRTYTKCKNVDYVMNAISFERLNHYTSLCLRDCPTQKVVLMAGWPASVKGVDVAVKAIAQLRSSQQIDIKLCIMQSGDFAQTETCVRRAIGDMPSWVQLLPPREDIASYYYAVDIFLSASRTEACPYCLVEAAYCTPMIISSDIPGPRELQIEGMQMFPMDDVAALVEVISSQLSLSDEQKRMICENRKNIITRYNLNDWCLQIIDWYHKVLKY